MGGGEGRTDDIALRHGLGLILTVGLFSNCHWRDLQLDLQVGIRKRPDLLIH